MIKSINIKKFRGINSLKLDGFKRINFFLGENNCGKTSILEALFLIIGMSNPLLTRNIHLFRGLNLTDNEDFRFLFYKLNFTSNIIINAETYNNEIRKLRIKPKFFSSSKVKISNGLSQEEKDEQESVSSASINNTQKIEKLNFNSLITNTKTDESNEIRTSISLSGNNVKTDKAEKYKEKLSGFFINSDTIFKGLNEKIEDILVNKQKDRLLKPLKKIEPKICDISLGNKGMVYLDLGYKRLVPINLLGDGIRRILSVLAKLLSQNNVILLFDEIENGLHYTSQKIFLRNLIKISELQNAQLFLTTHSIESLRTLKSILSSSELQKFQSETKCFTIRKYEGDNLKAYSYDYEKLDYAIEQDIEMR